MGVLGRGWRGAARTNRGRDTVFASLPEVRLAVTVSAWDSAALAVVPLPAWVAADDPLLRGSLPGLHSRHLQPDALAATLSRSVCAGTSGRAAPPYKRKTQQSRPSASGLPVASGHRRPCWSDAYACHNPAGLV